LGWVKIWEGLQGAFFSMSSSICRFCGGAIYPTQNNFEGVAWSLRGNRLICFTRLRGAGKGENFPPWGAHKKTPRQSSWRLTRCMPGQRRMSAVCRAYARQFLGQLAKPEWIRSPG
jgi:hypothetical protein